ncbi:mono-ADP-ribosyltransferase PARP12-like 2 [Homarus americanus]|uniref:Poly [ADP-ribose] polymerase n=1 Tax=Homarus americanus TaxID=6706 RepID=A0A8J5MX49_HOMAM|nr:mono-ADP-ribosyltransferase PARP12-like 2 [Homarus americanus]
MKEGEYGRMKEEEDRHMKEEEDRQMKEGEYRRMKEEEVDRRMKEEEDRCMKEEEDRQMKEEEYRRIKEEEYRQMKEEEYRRIKEEEVDRRMKEEEDRCMKEEEDRQMKEEEYRQMKEEEYRRIKEEEYRRMKEEEERCMKEEEYRRMKEEEYRRMKEEEYRRMKEEEYRRMGQEEVDRYMKEEEDRCMKEKEVDRRMKEEEYRRMGQEEVDRCMKEENRCMNQEDRCMKEENRRMKEEVDRRLKEVDRRMKEEIDRRMKEEIDRRMKEEVDRRTKEEVDRLMKEEIDRRTKEEVDRRLKEEVDRRLKEEVDRRTKEEVDRRLKEEVDRRTKEEVDRRTKEEVDNRPMHQEDNRPMHQEDNRPMHQEDNRPMGRQQAYASGRQQAYASGRQQAYASGRQQAYASGRQQAYGSGRQQAYAPGRQQAYRSGRQQAYASGRQQAYASGRQQAYASGRQQACASVQDTLDWEEDLNDPMEKVMLKCGRSDTRSTSVKENTRDSRGRGQSRGESQGYRGNFARGRSLKKPHTPRTEGYSSSDVDYRKLQDEPVGQQRGRYYRDQPDRGSCRKQNQRQQGCKNKSRGGYSQRGGFSQHCDGNYSPRDSYCDQYSESCTPRGASNDWYERSHTSRGHFRSQDARNYFPRGSYNDPNDRNFTPSGPCRDPGDWNYSQKNTYRGQGKGIRPWVLVEALAECPNFRATLLQLLEWKDLQLSAVREVVSSNSQVFAFNGEFVELQPKVNICIPHSGPQGCQKRSSCQDLHICLIYITRYCGDRPCVFGHKWYTDHNIATLRDFYLDRLPPPSLRNLMKGLTKPAGPTGQLDVCRDYNGKGCNKTDCGALHVCLSFVSGLTKCSFTRCKLNHDLLTPECSTLLWSHGFSTNEAPRDVAFALLAAYPSLANAGHGKQAASPPTTAAPSSSQASTSTTTSNQQQNIGATRSGRSDGAGIMSRLRQRIIGNASDKQAFAQPSVESKSQDTSTPSKSDKGGYTYTRHGKKDTGDSARIKKSSVQKKQKCQTVWSHYLEGDTEVNEICYYSVENLCRNESSGCQRLHASQHFHWQISEQGSKWLNLRSFQAQILEQAFCDQAQDGVVIPRLDPAKLNPSVKQLLTVLGRDSWQANFQCMIITNSDQSRILYLRRLCTECIAGQQIKANIYSWYFVDINKKWIKYGNVDTANESKLVSSVSSADIERHFLKNQHVPLTFKNSKYTYILDFVTMIQTNQNTKVGREVRRRPEPHLKDGNTGDNQNSATGTTATGTTATGTTATGTTSSDLPSTWDPMQPEERIRLVTVASTSPEYQTVVGLLGSGVPNTSVVKIERIQNPFLWRALQNKIKEMVTVYGDIKKVDVRQVFHGTRPDVVASICAENFDWRLHGSSTGQACGRGTYFSPNAGTSYGYSRNDSAGLRYMFVARVAVGSIVPGNSAMARPPTNPATGAPYDSTGDGTSVIVKYDKQEYYPEYIITLR